MAQQLTVEDAKESLAAHVTNKGLELHEKYGPHIGWAQLQAILQDRAVCRYPVEIVFDSKPLQPGEFAFPATRGNDISDGFILYIHPVYSLYLDEVPHLALYQLVLVNYGEFASSDEAEIFGACALGITREEYYRTLCELVDQLPGQIGGESDSLNNG